MVLDAVSSLLGGGGSAPPSVRRPAFSIQFGGNADAWAGRVIGVTVEAGLLPAIDAAEVYFSGDDNAPAAALGDAGEVALGYEDSSTDAVFTGAVWSLRRTIQRVSRVTATNGGATLAALRINRSYENQAAGDIVSNLAGEAGVDTDAIENGADFPYYVVDSGRNVAQHVAALARKCGFIAYFAPDGKLNFKPFVGGQPVQTFSYALDVLALSMTEAPAPAGAVKVMGEGAAGGQGSDAWNWLVKDPSSVTGEAGDGEPQRELLDASLRSADAAGGAATGIASAASLTQFTGELIVPGAPAAAVGTVVEVKDAPDSALNGQYFVRTVRHLYSKRGGFITRIGFSKTGEGGAGGGLLETLGGLL